MEKQKALNFLADNLDGWPTKSKGGPLVDGWTWHDNNDDVILVIKDYLAAPTLEAITIKMIEWQTKAIEKENFGDFGLPHSDSESVFIDVKYIATSNISKERASKLMDIPHIKQKIYIAGPMTGRENFNRPKFVAAENLLKMKGFTVLNPAWLPDGLLQKEYMQIDIAMLQCCDAIYLLEGWDDSTGAIAEKSIAYKLGLKIIHEGEIK